MYLGNVGSGGAASGFAAMNITPSKDLSAGTLVCVGWAYSQGSSTASVTDTKGNVYSGVGSSGAGGTKQAALFWSILTTGLTAASDHWTVTGSGSSGSPGQTVFVIAFDNVPSIGTSTSGNSGSAPFTVSLSSLIPFSALCVGVGAANSGSGVSLGGLTSVANAFNVSSSQPLYMAYGTAQSASQVYGFSSSGGVMGLALGAFGGVAVPSMFNPGNPTYAENQPAGVN